MLEPFEDPEAAIWAIYSPTRHLPGKVRAFVDFLTERFGGDSPAVPGLGGPT